MNALFEFNVGDTEPTEIAFGEWLPDLPKLNNPGALEALNVLPMDASYSPFPQHSPEKVLPETARGATAVISADDVVQIYAGTIAGIYTKFGGGDFEQIEALTSNDTHSWQFVRVNEQMVAIHLEHDPRRTPVGTSTPPVVLGGTPPRAACGAQVGDFLMLGNLLVDPDDGGNPFPSRVRWGGFNNIDADWITDPATQADFNDMPTAGGEVVAINGRERGTIYQRRMISVATYRGLPSVFDIVVAEDKRGAIARDCVVDVGAVQYFIADDGFFIFNGVNSSPIGDAKVNRYFFNRLQYTRRHRIVGAHDPEHGCVHWAFPTTSNGPCNEIITYSYRENRFTHTEIDVETIFTSALSNITVEELTDPLESYTESFDSETYRRGGRQRLAGFNSAHTYGLFDGAAMAATLETGDYSAPDGRRIFVNDARPLVDIIAPSITMRAAMRDQLIGEPIVFGDAINQEIDGRCPIINDARYMRFRVDIPANVSWQHATGVEINRRGGGSF